ncbi:MAG: hypothetical protein IT435_06180 [Phycisphaerales bacterium]|nr:hypothetical protein [Phycisphaerales bacterium]
MQTVVVILSALTIAWLFGQMLVNHLTHKVDLLSTRNIFYLGMINFQFFPITVCLWQDRYMPRLTPTDPATAGMIFIVFSWLFLAIFNLVYARGWVASPIARRVYSKFPVPSPNALLMLAVVFLVLGTINRFIIMTTPRISTLGAIFSIGFLGASAGCAMWAWLPRLWNPIYAIPGSFITLASMLVSMHLSFGRRDLLSVVLACVWAGYWGYLRERGNFAIFTRLGGIGAVGVVLLALLSATRGEAGEIRSINQIISDMSSSQVSSGIQHMATVQDAGPITLYLIDTRPGDFPYDTLHSLKYIITQPILREWWPEKPNALGMDIVTQAGVRNLARGFSYGPGLMGHIANDNPYLALPIYTVLIAIALSFLDRVCRFNLNNPFVMIPVGAGLGELMAVPRGELGLFAFRCVFMFLTAWFGMWAVAKLMIASGLQLQGTGADEAPDAVEDQASEPELQNRDQAPAADAPADSFPSLQGYRLGYDAAGDRN